MKRILSLLGLLSLLLTQNVALAAVKVVAPQVLSIAVHTPQLMPAGTVIMPGTQNVAFARIDMRTAANSGSKIDKIGLHMIGTSAASNALSNIRLVDMQGRLLARVAAPLANATIVLPGNGNVVGANSFAQFDVIADVTNQTRAGTLGLALDSMGTTSLATGQKIAVFPTPAAIKNGTLATIVAPVAAGELTLSINPQPLDGTLVPGAVGELLGRIDLRASQVEDVLVDQISIELNGRDENLQNLGMYYINEVGQEVPAYNGGVIANLRDNVGYSFGGFNRPITVRRGQTVTFVVRADVRADARGGDAISLVYNTLMRPIGAASGAVVRFNANFPTVWPAQTVVNSAELIATLSPLVFPAQSARMGEAHVLVGTIQLTAGLAEDVMLDQLIFTSSTNVLTNLSLVNRVTGQVVQRVAGLDANNRATFPDLIQLLTRGSSTTYLVYADLIPAGQAPAPDAFSVNIQNAGDISAWGLFSGENARISGTFPVTNRPVLIVR